ncbi:hypothetical protein ACSD30_000768 [Escherichia coli]|nr:hypothetical protein [Escherichia coli]EJG8081954.1 hypothetical protein [Escherichia coli]
MKHQHYGTKLVERGEVKPGTLLLYNGKIYTASANVKTGLHINTLLEKTIVKSNFITVFLDGKGDHLIN